MATYVKQLERPGRPYSRFNNAVKADNCVAMNNLSEDQADRLFVKKL